MKSPSQRTCESIGCVTRFLEFLDFKFSVCTIDEVLQEIGLRPETDSFAYIVTPNVDHVTRFHAAPENLESSYNGAWICLCDSKILSFLAKMSGRNLPVVSGSDLTDRMFRNLVHEDDKICVIGSDLESISYLQSSLKLESIAHYCPPMGLIDKPAEIAKCVDFVINNPSRYVFIAVGSPQQEVVANAIYNSKQATGIGFCIGASIDFITGKVARAPYWMRLIGIEWLHRLIENPRRMWKRYLIFGPRVFSIYAQWLVRHRRQ